MMGRLYIHRLTAISTSFTRVNPGVLGEGYVDIVHDIVGRGGKEEWSSDLMHDYHHFDASFRKYLPFFLAIQSRKRLEYKLSVSLDVHVGGL